MGADGFDEAADGLGEDAEGGSREDAVGGLREDAEGGPGAEDERGVEEMVAAYLAELSQEAERLDENARQELLDDVRSHIEVALAEADNPDRAEVTRILTALGSPREIVDAASPETPAGPAAPATSVLPPVPDLASQPWDPGPPYLLGGREIVAIAMLLVGFVLAGIGWLAGVWLLWSSPRWTRRDKLIGTFVLPGGLAPLVVLMGVATGGQSCVQTDNAPPECVQNGHGLPPWGAVIAVTLCVALPLVTTFHLWRRARAVRPLVAGGGGAVTGVLVGVAMVLGVMVAGCGLFMVASSSSEKSPAPAVSQEAPLPASGP